jgi:UDPglucose--hexose-1-phosphate uridylyltransferase
MNEMRQNKITQKWVIYSSARGRRPHELSEHRKDREDVPAFVLSCPFCPGNEHLTPPTIMQMPGVNGHWQTRVVSNKFPILRCGDDTTTTDLGVYLSTPGHGRHEVIIETPLHNEDVPFMTRENAEILVETYHRRYTDLARDDTLQMLFLFRNRGASAGTSLAHPHSQLIATGIVPPWVHERERSALNYFDAQGRCGYCDILDLEVRDGQRVVWENDSFLAFVPYAAEVPFEMWVMPRRHQADFGALCDSEKTDLTEALQEALARLHKAAHDPDYNYIVHTASKEWRHTPHLHWYIQIRPRIGIEAGFEIGSGMSVNQSCPEEDAALLKGTTDEHR